VYKGIISTNKTVEFISDRMSYTRVNPKISEMAAWSKNSKWYSSLPLDAVVSLFYESV
jgi:hypothetical protein